MAHVGLHHVQPEIGDHPAQFGRAAFVRGNLCLQIGHILRDVADGIGMIGQQVVQRLFAKAPLRDHPEIVDQHAFLVHGRGKRRHRSRRGPTHIGMVPARRDPEQDGAAGVVEDRRDDGDVGQMRAAVVGRVQSEHVARMDVALVQTDHRFDRSVH